MYQKNQAKSVSEQIVSSRVDMLIAMYDAAIEATARAERSLRDNNDHEAALARSQALGFVGLIESGLDLQQGDIPKRIRELCGFVEQSLLSSNTDEIAASTRVLRNLRDGFIGIRAEARALENSGAIPRLSAKSVDTLV